MKNKRNLYALMALAVFMSSCSDDHADPQPPAVLEVQMAEDIPADANGERGDAPNYTFLSLQTGEIIDKADSNSLQWDIALAGTDILVNGGVSGPGQGAAQIIEGIFEEIKAAPETGYLTDGESGPAIANGGNGWYTYTGATGTPAHAILPTPGKVIVLKTAEGNYAKLEILSYYKGSPDPTSEKFASTETRADDRYYTIRYVLQGNGGRNF